MVVIILGLVVRASPWELIAQFAQSGEGSGQPTGSTSGRGGLLNGAVNGGIALGVAYQVASAACYSLLGVMYEVRGALP
jgi:hypothetical protein